MSVFPGRSWETQTPAQAGLDEAVLNRLAEHVGGRGCVVRHGRMVYAWGDPIRSTDAASAFKPVLSTLLMFAMQDGLIESVDNLVGAGGWPPTSPERPTKHLAGDNSAPFRLEGPHPARHTPATSKKQMPISQLFPMQNRTLTPYIVVSALMMGISPFAVAGVVLYETGFELPAFVADQPLAGQDGWGAYGGENVQAATVTAENSLSGTQSAKLDGALMAPYRERDYYAGFYSRGVPFDPIASGYSIVEFSLDVFYVPREGGSDARAQVEMYDSQGGYIGAFSVHPDGMVMGFSEQGPPLVGSCDVAQWNNFRATIDYVDRSVEFHVNGDSLGAAGLDPLVIDFHTAELSLVVNYQQNNHAAYYDNYRISAHPSPVRLVPRIVNGGLEVSFSAALSVAGVVETAPDLLSSWTEIHDAPAGVTIVFIEAAQLPASPAFFRLVEAP